MNHSSIVFAALLIMTTLVACEGAPWSDKFQDEAINMIEIVPLVKKSNVRDDELPIQIPPPVPENPIVTDETGTDDTEETFVDYDDLSDEDYIFIDDEDFEDWGEIWDPEDEWINDFDYEYDDEDRKQNGLD